MMRPVSRPATRVLALLEILQDRSEVPGPELAARLEVGERTVRRYAVRLQELGIPVEARRGRHGGYRLRPGYKLPPLMLTDDEATAIVIGLAAARHLGLATAAPAVDGALAKLRRVLPGTLRERTGALEAALGFTRPLPAGAPPATGTALTLAEGVRLGRRVRVRYRDREGVASERDLDPFGLVVHSGRWYLAALDHDSGELRTFRADRVAEAELRPEPAPLPAGFDAVAHVSRALARVPWTHEVEVLLDCTPAEARGRLPATLAELEPAPGGRVCARMRAERLDGMARLLAGLEWPFTIVRPEALRDAVERLAGELAVRARAR